MIDSVESFSSDYQTARAKFLQAAAATNGQLSAIRHPEHGPDGAGLFVDVARFGPADASRLIVLISATHGVEGFCGSGAQVDLLRRGEIGQLPPDTGALLIHAINPYGFAWLRRTTHENIDLNRNWIDFSAPLPENPGYRELHPALCPAAWSPETREGGQTVLAAYATQHGADAAKNALGGGQYEFPDGLYYGGRAPSWSRVTQTEILRTHAAGARKVAILDYHTGLGPWGLVEQIVSLPPSSAAYRRACCWYGGTVRSTLDGSSAGARIGGDGLAAAVEILAPAEVTPLFLEFGTLPREAVVPANRADNWLHVHGDTHSPQAAAIKRDLRDAYYGDRNDWKGMVAGQSLMIWRQTLAGLQLEP